MTANMIQELGKKVKLCQDIKHKPYMRTTYEATKAECAGLVNKLKPYVNYHEVKVSDRVWATTFGGNARSSEEAFYIELTTNPRYTQLLGSAKDIVDRLREAVPVGCPMIGDEVDFERMNDYNKLLGDLVKDIEPFVSYMRYSSVLVNASIKRYSIFNNTPEELTNSLLEKAAHHENFHFVEPNQPINLKFKYAHLVDCPKATVRQVVLTDPRYRHVREELNCLCTACVDSRQPDGRTKRNMVDELVRVWEKVTFYFGDDADRVVYDDLVKRLVEYLPEEYRDINRFNGESGYNKLLSMLWLVETALNLSSLSELEENVTKFAHGFRMPKGDLNLSKSV